MRTVQEVRNRLLHTLHQGCRRPGMYGGTAFGVELLLDSLLTDLCFIDEQESALPSEIERLKARRLFNSCGVRGAMTDRLSRLQANRQASSSLEDEVASVYAEIGDRLGYLTLERRLDADDWLRLRRCPRRRGLEFPKEAIRVADILETFGAPSFTKGMVQAYWD